MTKFEESLRKIKPRKKFLEFNAGITYWYCLSDLIQKFGNWHSDEEFQKVVEKGGSFSLANKNLIDENEKLAEEISDLNSQLKQQALPVVPEFVAEWLDSNNLASLLDEWYCHYEDMSYHIREYFERLPYKGPNNLSEMENNIVTFITRAKLGGYKLEKPQLFYLKNKLTGLYLYKKPLGGYGEEPTSSIKNLTDDFKFTQKEIDGMDVQSYEKKDEYKGE